MKKIFFILIIIINAFLFLFAPVETVEASKTGIMLWFYQIFPTLFPWTILSNIMIHSNLLQPDEKDKVKCINKTEWLVLFFGFLFGFPIGSKLAADFYSAGLLKKKRAQILCACSNQFSISYINSFVLAQVLHINHPIWWYFAVLYGPSLILGISLLLCDYFYNVSDKSYIHKKSASRFQMNMQIIDAGIINGFEALIKLCGYIVMFSILTNGVRMLLQENSLVYLIFSNLLETTTGIATMEKLTISYRTKLLVSITALNFGGISCLAQTGSVISKTDLSLTKYALFRIILTVLSSIISFILLFILRIC